MAIRTRASAPDFLDGKRIAVALQAAASLADLCHPLWHESGLLLPRHSIGHLGTTNK